MRLSRQAFYLILFLLPTITGLAWIIRNAHSVPLYGDTVEYLALAGTFKIDQYRTILYPLFLHVLGLSSSGGAPIYTYLAQFTLLLTTSTIFASAFIRDIDEVQHSKAQRWLITAIATVMASTAPLSAHFSLSLMSDSLAASFTIGAVGAAIHALIDYKSHGLRWRWVSVTALFLFLMSLSRVDKLYLGFVFVLAIVVCLQRMGRSLRKHYVGRDCVYLSVALCIPLAATMISNHLTQTYNPNRPPLNASCLAFNRVVWPRLEKVYPYLPEDARALISESQAREFDADPIQVYILLTRLLNGTPNGKHVINEITLETLRRFPGAVVGKTTFDIGKYALPTLSFPLELVSALPKSGTTSWTYSRMRMFSPRLTRLWLLLSFACLLLVQLPLAARNPMNIPWKKWIASPSVSLALVAIVTNALLFGLEAGMDAHIRYALPTFILEFEIIVILSLTSIFWRHTTPDASQAKTSDLN